MSPGFVYFVEAIGLDRVKIGSTMNPHFRIKALQTTCPADLKILLLLPGGATAEKKLHKRFAAHRVRGEWFEMAEPIRQFLVDHAETYEGWLQSELKAVAEHARLYAAGGLRHLKPQRLS